MLFENEVIEGGIYSLDYSPSASKGSTRVVRVLDRNLNGKTVNVVDVETIEQMQLPIRCLSTINVSLLRLKYLESINIPKGKYGHSKYIKELNYFKEVNEIYNSFNSRYKQENTKIDVDKFMTKVPDTNFAKICIPDKIIFEVAYNGNKFIAVGADGILVSYNGYDWECIDMLKYTSSRGPMTAVIYNEEYKSFVVVGEHGTILTSSDGIHWNNVIKDNDNKRVLFDIKYGNGMYITVGKAGTLYTSYDGKEWVQRTMPSQSDLYRIIYRNGLFVVLDIFGRVFTSINGFDWNEITSIALTPSSNMIYNNQDRIYDVAFCNNEFIITTNNGYILKSADGVHWHSYPINIDKTLFNMVYCDGIYIANVILQNDMMVSTDSINWKPFGKSNLNIIKMYKYNDAVFVCGNI